MARTTSRSRTTATASRATRTACPNFKYVATHICDSIKRRLKTEGVGTGLQGEFGIGLLSFWTVGDTLDDDIGRLPTSAPTR